MTPMTLPGRVRLYQTVRSAHLERARALAPAVILYGQRRYDFDDRLAAGLEMRDGSDLAACRYLWRHPPAILEVNEPLMIESAIWTAAAVLTTLARRSVGGPRTRIVTYSIENRDPFQTPPPARLKSRVRRLLEWLSAVVIWRSLDRIVYGTAAAEQLYGKVLGPGRAMARLIWALPAAQPASAKEHGTALFVSAFSHRKGVLQLLQSWRDVTDRLPAARLLMIGTGALVEDVTAAAASDPSITALVAPPRNVIRTELERAAVLALPSQPTGAWREQVGLPIVEGLSHGCTIVTTDQTGLAEWLRDHGHHVIEGNATAEVLAQALAAALSDPQSPESVRNSLPQRDGRLAADDWMMADAAQ